MVPVDLQQNITDAFADLRRPAGGEIVGHDCDECSRIRSDLAPYAWSQVPGEVLEYHCDSFPLLTPQAFRYYLPGFVIYALNNPDSAVARWVIENLRDLGQPNDFWVSRAEFTEPQKTAIRKVLHFIYESPQFRQYRADSFDALILWGEHPNPKIEPDAQQAARGSS